MNKKAIIEICKKVLEDLILLGDEKHHQFSKERLIFPTKNDNEIRISEQEFRFLFVKEFIKRNESGYYYSIETPTEKKYSFGHCLNEIKVNQLGQSALADMMIYKRVEDLYIRDLNIEFKHKNVELSHIAKDILKLINETPNGAFIHLLDNTNAGTLCNKNNSISKKETKCNDDVEFGTGVLDKLRKSFERFDKYWNSNDKQITIVIMSLEQKAFIYKTIKESDWSKVGVFSFKEDCGNILSFENSSDWELVKI